jgi:hypothetical protein
MTGPLVPDRTLPVNADVSGPYDVSAVTSQARRAWESLEERGRLGKTTIWPLTCALAASFGLDHSR